MWDDANNPVNWYAQPVYDSILGGGWSCQDWITWFNALKAHYGQQSAAETWRQAWESQGFFAQDYSWCKYSPVFHQFLIDNGLTDQTNVIADTTVGVQSSIGNIVDTITNSTNVLKYAAPVFIIAFSIIILITAKGAAAKS
jgi:hypothetical protein